MGAPQLLPIGPSPVPPPASIAAEKLHLLLLKSHRLGNRVRHRFAQALLALAETGHYQTLGYSSIYQYAEKHFGYRRTLYSF